MDCGLCCDGTMYSFVVLQDVDDRRRLSRLKLTSARDQTTFHQPCPAHQAGRCTVYNVRPAICAEYRCALLRACDNGTVTETDARLLINETIVLRNRVQKKVRDFMQFEEPVALPRLFELMVEKLDKMDAGERRQVDAQMLLDVGTLRVALATRFEPKDTKLAKSAAADTPVLKRE